MSNKPEMQRESTDVKWFARAFLTAPVWPLALVALMVFMAVKDDARRTPREEEVTDFKKASYSTLAEALTGKRIVKVVDDEVLVLEDGVEVELVPEGDCCAYLEVQVWEPGAREAYNAEQQRKFEEKVALEKLRKAAREQREREELESFSASLQSVHDENMEKYGTKKDGTYKG